MLEQWKCKTHDLVMIYDPEKQSRDYRLRMGSTPACALLSMVKVEEGKFGNCEIVKEG